MIWGIIVVILDGLDSVFYQKAINTAKDMSKTLLNLLGYFGGLLLGAILFALGFLDFGEMPTLLNNPIILVLLVVMVIIDMINSPLRQIAYKNEKISSLLPYERISALLTIIISFFWIGGVSVFSFIVTLGILVLLAVEGIDFKNIQAPGNKRLIFVIQGIELLDSLITIYVLKVISETFYYSVYVILGIVIISLFLIIGYGKKSVSSLKQQSKTFYLDRTWTSLAGYASWLISLFLIKELGPVITFLIGFLSVGVTLVMSYFFQGDKPTKKDCILAVVVTLMVGVAYYFQ